METRYIYGIQVDATGEVLYSSADEAKVRQVFEEVTGGDPTMSGFSLVSFERMLKFPIRPGVAVDQMGFMFGHDR